MLGNETELTALVLVLGGAPVEVVLGFDLDALEERGRQFVEEQGCNAYYALLDVEYLDERE